MKNEYSASQPFEVEENWTISENWEISTPTYPWKMEIGNMTIPIEKDKEPNRFHRFMQTLILGIKWEKY